MSEVTIKKGSIQVTLNRSDLVQAEETADGIVFNFKEGLHLYLTDTDMPIFTKNLIKVTVDRFSTNKLIFDLANYKTPATVDAT